MQWLMIDESFLLLLIHQEDVNQYHLNNLIYLKL